MMRITWLQPWFHRQMPGMPKRTAAASRWPFNRLGRSCAPIARAAGFSRQPLPSHRVTFSLPHHVDVASATQYLLPTLGCDDWYVACRHDHQMLVRLTQGGTARYCVSYDCSAPVEKAIYHGSRAWTMTLIPLTGEDNLDEETVAEIEAALGKLHA